MSARLAASGGFEEEIVTCLSLHRAFSSCVSLCLHIFFLYKHVTAFSPPHPEWPHINLIISYFHKTSCPQLWRLGLQTIFLESTTQSTIYSFINYIVSKKEKLTNFACEWNNIPLTFLDLVTSQPGELDISHIIDLFIFIIRLYVTMDRDWLTVMHFKCEDN